MELLDNLVLRKRRDLLYSRTIEPYEFLREAMFQYVPPAVMQTVQEELTQLHTQYEREAAQILQGMRAPGAPYNAPRPAPPPTVPQQMPTPDTYQGLADSLFVRRQQALNAARREVLDDSVGMSRHRQDDDTDRAVRQRAGVYFRPPGGGSSINIQIPHSRAAGAA
jgi:hypothetical protein